MAQELKDQKLEVNVLVWLGFNYNALGEKQKALDFYNQALPLYRAVGDRTGEAVTLGHIGVLFQSTNQPTQAITNLEQSLKISLEMRRGLQLENRQNFLQENGGSAIAFLKWQNYLKLHPQILKILHPPSQQEQL